MLLILTNCYQVKLIKNLSEHRKFILWLSVLWTVVVTLLCLITFDKLPSVGVANFDKLGHITFHFGITFSWFLSFKYYFENPHHRAIVKAFAFSVLFGVTIEIIQSQLTVTRRGDIADVLANTAGSLLAFIIITVITKSLARNNT